MDRHAKQQLCSNYYRKSEEHRLQSVYFLNLANQIQREILEEEMKEHGSRS